MITMLGTLTGMHVKRKVDLPNSICALDRAKSQDKLFGTLSWCLFKSKVRYFITIVSSTMVAYVM